jgi:hypothetical protein
MRFIFPSEPFNTKKPEAEFLDQIGAMCNAGFEISLIALEDLAEGNARVVPVPAAGSHVIYRGWMLSPLDYASLVAAVQANGAELRTSLNGYLSTHYLPNWYPLIADLTPETRVFGVDADFEQELRSLGWSRFFIKDYVKSLKTSAGAAIIDDPAQIDQVVAEMQKFRGSIEGGLCVRRVEDFILDTERRYFVIQGQVCGSAADEPIPEIVMECASRISSPFFSVDVIDRTDGVQRIVEVGDGQVSGLVGWGVDRFAELWKLPGINSYLNPKC